METTRFNIFQELPLELRQRVFELALPSHGPRVLGTHYMHHPDSPALLLSAQPLYRACVLNIALVSREAYETVRRIYSICHAGVFAIVAGECTTFTMPVQFNRMTDTLFPVGRYLTADCSVPSCTCLPSMMADKTISLAVPFLSLVNTAAHGTPRDEADQKLRTVFKSLTARKHCTIVISHGPWAMGGDQRIGQGTLDVDAERQVLIDIRDTASVDNYKACAVNPASIFKRWASHRTVDGNNGTDDGNDGTGDGNNGARNAERDVEAILHHVRRSWLELNGCFDPRQGVDGSKPLVEWTARPPSSIEKPTSWEKLDSKDWDYEDPVAKALVDKLPGFTVAALVRDPTVAEPVPAQAG